jgi:hypothetical protein
LPRLSLAEDDGIETLSILSLNGKHSAAALLQAAQGDPDFECLFAKRHA